MQAFRQLAAYSAHSRGKQAAAAAGRRVNLQLRFALWQEWVPEQRAGEEMVRAAVQWWLSSTLTRAFASWLQAAIKLAVKREQALTC